MTLLDYSLNSESGTGKIDCPVFGAIAALSDCSPTTVYMFALGHKQPSARLAGRIEQATNGGVTRQDLRPDVFGELHAVVSGKGAAGAVNKERK